MGVTLSERASEESLVVPWSAILTTSPVAHGSMKTLRHSNTPDAASKCAASWIRCAVLARGPAVGAKVVTAGAAEIFGTEFGTGK